MTTKKPARPAVKLVCGHAITTSTAIAKFFGRRHDDVLKRIRQTIADCPPEYHLRNFAEVIREVDSGKGAKVSYTEYRLTRDGFTLLAMGFTGKAALEWKIKYIEAFNHLEARASAHAIKRAERRALAMQQKALAAPPQLEEEALHRLRAGKFELYFGEDGFMMLHSISRKAIVVEPGELAGRIADPKGDIGREHLPGIIQAAAQRLE